MRSLQLCEIFVNKPILQLSGLMLLPQETLLHPPTLVYVLIVSWIFPFNTITVLTIILFLSFSIEPGVCLYFPMCPQCRYYICLTYRCSINICQINKCSFIPTSLFTVLFLICNDFPFILWPILVFL